MVKCLYRARKIPAPSALPAPAPVARPPSLLFADAPSASSAATPAEYVLKRSTEEVTVEEVVKAVRPEGRATVPDSIKAELLTHLKTFILNLQ
jgi:hypothetical protein